MRIYDVSVGINPELPVWPGDPPVELKRSDSIAKGSQANVSRLSCGVHVGTHVDAPIHFIEGGASIDELSLKVLIGRAYVVHLPKANMIDRKALESAGIPPRTRRVLFRTRNSKLWGEDDGAFHKDFVAIDAGGAEWLVQKGIQLVGVDYLSVAPWSRPAPTHRILLEAGVVIVEGLDLRQVSQGRYDFYCLPIKLMGSDGAPARVILTGV